MRYTGRAPTARPLAMYTTDSTSIHEKSGQDHLVDEPTIFSALRTILKAGIFVAVTTAGATAVLGWRMVPFLCCFAAVALTAGLILGNLGWRRAGIMVGLTGSGYAALHAAAF